MGLGFTGVDDLENELLPEERMVHQIKSCRKRSVSGKSQSMCLKNVASGTELGGEAAPCESVRVETSVGGRTDNPRLKRAADPLSP
jgi:hypothetical protein